MSIYDMAEHEATYLNQKFIGLLIILLGTISLLGFGFITGTIFQTTVLWAFAIFSGAEVGQEGVKAYGQFKVEQEKRKNS